MLVAVIVYTFLLLSMLFLGLPITSRIDNNSIVNDFVIKKIVYYSPIIILSIILGYRYGVGVDYFSYESLFYSQNRYSIFESDANEYIFGCIYYLFWCLGYSFQTLQVFLIAITFVFFYKAFEKHKALLPFAILFLFFTGLLFCYLNIQRQGIAFFILLYSVKYIEHRRFIPFILTVIIACGFHSSSILFLLLWFYQPIKFLIKYPIIQFFFWIVSLCFSQKILNLIIPLVTEVMNNTDYARYGSLLLSMELTTGSGVGVILKEISIFVFICYSRKMYYNFPQNHFKICYISMFVGTIAMNIFSTSLLLNRISFIFESFRFVVLAYLFRYFINNKNICTILVKNCLLMLYILYFFGMIYLGNNNCSPFKFAF